MTRRIGNLVWDWLTIKPLLCTRRNSVFFVDTTIFMEKSSCVGSKLV